DGAAVSSTAGDELRERFRLASVHLSPALVGPEEVSRRMIGRLAAEVLRGAVRDGAVVGIGDGASISAAADALAADEPLHETGATVIPLCGGYWFTGPAREPFRRVADGIGGLPIGLLAPGLVDDPVTKRSLVAHAGVRRIADLWERVCPRSGDRSRSRAVRRGRRSARQPVRPRGPVRLRRAPRAHDRVRRARA